MFAISNDDFRVVKNLLGELQRLEGDKAQGEEVAREIKQKKT